MNVKRYENIDHLKSSSKILMKKMLSPLCGINQEIGYVARTESDPCLMIGAGALTGIHVLFNRPNPGRGAYHIGGTGILPEESMIRILAESIERYAQLMSDFAFANRIEFKNYHEISQASHSVISFDALNVFAEHQYGKNNFPFSKCTRDTKLAWIQMQSFQQDKKVYVPAQCVLVGYNIRFDQDEPWISSAVTTGTATHVTYGKALKAALLELIQLDSVMGHWYSSWKAYRIKFDARLKHVNSLIEKSRLKNQHSYTFYYIPNPDLIGFTVACVYFQKSGLPKTVIGLGADLALDRAIYKSYLEAVASVGLARMLVFKGQEKIEKHVDEINPHELYDLDRNVEYYALGNNFSRIEERFFDMEEVPASECPEDVLGSK